MFWILILNLNYWSKTGLNFLNSLSFFTQQHTAKSRWLQTHFRPRMPIQIVRHNFVLQFAHYWCITRRWWCGGRDHIDMIVALSIDAFFERGVLSDWLREDLTDGKEFLERGQFAQLIDDTRVKVTLVTNGIVQLDTVRLEFRSALEVICDKILHFINHIITSLILLETSVMVLKFTLSFNFFHVKGCFMKSSTWMEYL